MKTEIDDKLTSAICTDFGKNCFYLFLNFEEGTAHGNELQIYLEKHEAEKIIKSLKEAIAKINSKLCSSKTDIKEET